MKEMATHSSVLATDRGAQLGEVHRVAKSWSDLATKRPDQGLNLSPLQWK